MAGELFPLECVQLIQDSFADALGVMVLLTDLEGSRSHSPAIPAGLFTAAETSPVARQRCLELWARIASEPSMAPRFVESHLGLLCARGLIRVGSEIKAMLVVGGIAPQDWPPSDQQIDHIARDLALAPTWCASTSTRCIAWIRPARRVCCLLSSASPISLPTLPGAAGLAGRLQRIAEISRL